MKYTNFGYANFFVYETIKIAQYYKLYAFFMRLKKIITVWFICSGIMRCSENSKTKNPTYAVVELQGKQKKKKRRLL